jgi:hypothetical protein
MKYYKSPVIAALLISLFTGCSKHSPAATHRQITDLGVVDVSDGKPTTYTLPGGEVCVITPTTNLPDGTIYLAARFNYTNSSGTKKTMTFNMKVPSDKTVVFPDPNTNLISFTPSISK